MSLADADPAFPDRPRIDGPVWCMVCKADVPISQTTWTQMGDRAHVVPEYPYKQHPLGRMVAPT